MLLVNRYMAPQKRLRSRRNESSCGKVFAKRDIAARIVIRFHV